MNVSRQRVGSESYSGSHFVTAAIAAAEGWPPGALWIERGIVWRTHDDGFLRSVCAVGTPFWHEHAAAAIAERAIAQARARR